MSGLVDELRRGTTAGSDEYKVDDVSYWTEDQLKGVLASHTRREDRVRAATNYSIHGAVFSAELELNGVLDVEDPGTLVDRQGEEIELGSGNTIDRHGHIEFETDMRAALPIYWAGSSCDLAAAASEVLLTWANALSTAYDVKMDGQELSRSQMTENLRKAAEEMTGKGSGIGSIRTPATYGVNPRSLPWSGAWRTW